MVGVGVRVVSHMRSVVVGFNSDLVISIQSEVIDSKPSIFRTRGRLLAHAQLSSSSSEERFSNLISFINGKCWHGRNNINFHLRVVISSA